MIRALLNASIASKMMAVLALVVSLFLGTLLLVYLPAFERELLRDRRESLKQMVEVAHSLLVEYHQRVETGELSLADAQNRAILRIGNLRYGRDGYFWLNDTTLPFPRLIRHPILAGLQGVETDDERFRKASHMQFGDGGRIQSFPSSNKNLMQAFVEVVHESGDGFVTYAWPRPTPDGSSKGYYPKESYVKLFAPWGWVVGTGTYIDDIQARLSRLRWTILAATGAILAAAMVLLAAFIVGFITRPMTSLMRYAERISAGDRNPRIGGRFYGEADRLKSVITQMVADLENAIRQAEARRGEALQEAEKNRLLTGKLDALFKSMAELVVLHELVLDESGKPVDYRIVGCNAAFEEAAGIRKEDIVGKRATEFYYADTAPHLEEFSRVALGGPPLSFETRDALGDRDFLLSVVSPAPNEFVTIATDITKRKRAEQLLAEKNKELEQIIYAASHDLRSPLVNIDGYGRELEFAIAAILAALDDDAPAEAKRDAAFQAAMPEALDALRHIRNSTRQMESLIKGLLNLSRSGRSALAIAPLDMDALLAKVISSAEYRAKQSGIELTASALPPCKGDAVQLARVFSNLIDNAMKFLDPSRPGLVSVWGAIDKSRSVYCVEDNGIGIAPEHREKIFELFRRLDPARTEGEGLGLAIVRQILGRLDGDIWVESTPGAGSRFFVSLPLARPPDPPPGAKSGGT